MKLGFLVILVISIFTTYIVAIFQSISDSTMTKAGFPLNFGTYSIFGQAETNYLYLFVDIIFWFIVLWSIWKILSKIFRKS
jgi:hypothetical protein